MLGVYGIGGSGVELLKKRLEVLLQQSGNDVFQYFEIRYDLDGVDQATDRPTGPRSEDDLDNLRKREMANIRELCRQSGKVGLVFCHRRLIRSDLNNSDGLPLIRSARWGLDPNFSRAFYYTASPGDVVKTLLDDPTYLKIPRKRLTQKMIRAWDSEESASLVHLCNSHGVPILTYEAGKPGIAEELVNTILLNSQTNQQRVVSEVVVAMDFNVAPSNAVVLIEAHNILAWDVASTRMWIEVISSLKASRASSAAALRRDTYTILRQEAKAYGDRFQKQLSKGMTMDPELERLLWKLTHTRIPTVVLTCGFQSTWREVLERPISQEPDGTRCLWEKRSDEQHPGLGDRIKVVGTGESGDALVVSPEDKVAVVRALREKHGRRVYVIGGTRLDVPMLKAARQDAFVRPPSVGELHSSVKALLREHGGQATYLGRQAEALRSGWQGGVSDIYETMGMNGEERKVDHRDDEEILKERGTELEYMLDQAGHSLEPP